MSYSIGLGLQLVGLAAVSVCFFSGVSKGDYGKPELIQLVAGIGIFYLGHFLRGRGNVR